MLQKTILFVVVFVVILAALTFGESAATQALSWLSAVTGLVMNNLGDLYWAVHDYIRGQPAKVLLALVLTVPVSLWLFRRRSGTPASSATDHRRLAIVLAVFLGWLGVHRFYLNQIGAGIIYLIICFFAPPVSLLLGLIDALRYAFTDPADMPGAPRPPTTVIVQAAPPAPAADPAAAPPAPHEPR